MALQPHLPKGQHVVSEWECFGSDWELLGVIWIALGVNGSEWEWCVFQTYSRQRRKTVYHLTPLDFYSLLFCSLLFIFYFLLSTLYTVSSLHCLHCPATATTFCGPTKKNVERNKKPLAAIGTTISAHPTKTPWLVPPPVLMGRMTDCQPPSHLPWPEIRTPILRSRTHTRSAKSSWWVLCRVIVSHANSPVVKSKVVKRTVDRFFTTTGTKSMNGVVLAAHKGTMCTTARTQLMARNSRMGNAGRTRSVHHHVGPCKTKCVARTPVGIGPREATTRVILVVLASG